MADSPEAALGHWSKLFPGLQTPPLDFYARVETAVQRRAIPNTVVERVEFREGGAFSGIRQYLRVRRRREVFDICGAPFGNDFFFSWWFAEVKPTLPKAATIVIVFLYLGIVGFFVERFGPYYGPLALVLIVPLLLFVASNLGKPETDDFILQLPFIGQLYERLFRPITYYRIDTSEMFQQAVQKLVMDVIEEVTAANGIRALTELERKPVMRDFFKK
jgi:hypothetical protein